MRKRLFVRKAKVKWGKKEERTLKEESPTIVFPKTLGGIYLPDCLPQIRAIAARGFTDDEIAVTFGVDKELFAAWKKAYPDFRQALERGRLMPDIAVTQALWQRAVGYDYTEEGLTKTGAVKKLRRHLPGDVGAQRYWLNNRQKEFWGDRNTLELGGDRAEGAKPIGIKSEGRAELIAAIVGMINPKPDNVPEKK